MITLDAMRNQILVGDALATLRTMLAASVNTVITSPPYYGLRDYGAAGQIGLEQSPLDYVARLTEVFSEVYRVLRDDGTLWLNIGDTSARGTVGRNDKKGSKVSFQGDRDRGNTGLHGYQDDRAGFRASGQSKQLLGLPWRVAFALQDAGWILRQDIIWSKPSCMPESVVDRPTRSHEYIFLFAKARFYYFDMDSFREPAVQKKKATPVNGSLGVNQPMLNSGRRAFDERWTEVRTLQPERTETRNRRSVWEVATVPTTHAHFATFPPKLIEPMVLAGCPQGGIVLDPFMGSGTTGMVAKGLGADFMGIEINPEYAALARRRIAATRPGLPMLGMLSKVVAS